MRVVIFPDKDTVKGWTGTNNDEVLTYPVLDIAEAIRTQFDTFAHFCPLLVSEGGEVPPELPRINQTALPYIEASGSTVQFEGLCLDVDCPEAHRPVNPLPEAPDSWWAEQLALLQTSPLYPTCGWYRTKRGYRVLWRLAEPAPLKEYLKLLHQAHASLAKVGITADRLFDYNRLYSLPQIVRESGIQRLEFNIDHLGALDPTLMVDIQPADNSSFFAGISSTYQSFQLPPTINQMRNVTLARAAGAMRRLGMEADSIYTTLAQINQDKCDPPLEDGEVMRIAKSITRYEPEPTPVVQERDLTAKTAITLEHIRTAPVVFQLGSELEIANKVLEAIEDDVPTVFDRGSLWKYQPERGVWAAIEEAKVRRFVHLFDGANIATGMGKEGIMKTKPLRVSQSLSNNVCAMIQDLRATPGFFDAQRPGCAFLNGFWDPALGFQAHSSDQRSTFYVPFDYVPDANPKQFVSFLMSCFAHDFAPEIKVQLLREMLGVFLVGEATRFEQALILLGHGSNGKSTFLKVIQELFPTENLTAVPPQEMDKPYNRARLVASRLNLVAELPPSEIMAGEAFKNIISGDATEAAHKYGHPFTFLPKAGHVFAANRMPPTRDQSHGFWRRWQIITWNIRFNDANKDIHLADKLRSEVDLLASWLVEGAANALVRGHYVRCQDSIDNVQEWCFTADPVTMFLNTVCEQGDDWTSATVLYTQYVKWCRESGHSPKAKARFYRDLATQEIPSKRKAAGTFYALKLVAGE